MRVCFDPHYPGNPYQKILADALKEHGVQVQYGLERPYDLLHIHWQDRWLGKTLPQGPKVWTCHNVLPHAGGDMEAMKVFVGQMDAVICHTDYMQQQLRQLFGVEATVLAHPHYKEHYPNNLTKQQARAILGLDMTDEVWLHFGSIKPYKRVDKLIGQFMLLPGEHRKLLIAGQVHKVDLVKLKALVAEDERVKLMIGFVPDGEVQTYFKAADVLVLAYDKITTSGSAMLGMSFGLNIVVPDLPEIRSQVPSGAFYKKHLEEVLLHVKTTTAQTLGLEHEPRIIAEKTARVYQKVMEGRI